MELTRRNVLVYGSVTAAAISLGAAPAFAAAIDDAIADLTKGAEMVTGGDLSLTAPEIAENGNTVPVGVDAPGAVSVTLFADGNPTPAVASLAFGPLAASNSASTRIRLARTQNVVAVAEMADGSFQMASAEVKVTIGGCGG